MLLAALLVAAAACGSSVEGTVRPPAVAVPSPSADPGPVGPTAGPTPGLGSPSGGPGPACPAAYQPPDPDRPTVTLAFDVSADHGTIRGQERVVFRPDAPITEVVFRLWPNGQDHAAGSLTLTSAEIDGQPVQPRLESAGARAGTPGTLLTLPLAAPVPAGGTVTVDLGFTLVLPPPAIDRVGHTAMTSWWGTGHPLLAWVRGRGWVRTPATHVLGEAAVSETARTEITVTAPADDTVLATGLGEAPVTEADGRRTWRFRAEAVRDVAVAVGRFSVDRDVLPSGAPLIAGVAGEVDQPPDFVAEQTLRAVEAVEDAYGAFPYESLSIAALPGIDGAGVEFPGMLFVGDSGDSTIVTHEVAHMWFYGLVGNDQGRDPWLDESFAQYVQRVADGDVEIGEVDRRALALDGPVGVSMTEVGTDPGRYFGLVYFKGAAALLMARQAVGPEALAAALRCYVNANAWTVAEPADVAAALTGLPRAIEVLRTAGALP